MISAGITLLLTILFLILCFIFSVARSNMLPPGEKEYEVVGSIDFGDLNMGSKQVNNFQPAVENPSETVKPVTKPVTKPVSAPKAEAKPTPSVKPVKTTNPAKQPVITTDKPSEVTAPKVEKPTQETPTENNTVKTNETKSEQSQNNTETKNDNSEASSSTTSKPGDGPGSNHGTNESGTGNQGSPDIKELDPGGLYSFGGTGKGGLSGRRPLSLKSPSYTVQEEGELKFEFVIKPDGTVAYAKVVGLTNKPGLKAAGIAAIKKWRFNSLNPEQAQKNQRVQVTIKFKLKN